MFQVQKDDGSQDQQDAQPGERRQGFGEEQYPEDRRHHGLNGGQQKMVLIAQTLVRSPSLILLDEPVNSLDMQKQLELCEILKTISIQDRVDIVAILHDINLAPRFADYLIALDHNGTVYSHSAPGEIVTKSMLEDVYGVIGDVVLDGNRVPHIMAQRSVSSLRRNG